MFFSHGCARMAPNAKFDASIWTRNITFQSGDLRIGAEVRHSFNLLKDSLYYSVQMNSMIRA